MRQRLEQEIYNVMFLEDGGLIGFNGPTLSFAVAKRTQDAAYRVAAAVADRTLKTLRDASEPMVEAMAAVVVADGDLRQEWQAGIDAAGRR